MRLSDVASSGNFIRIVEIFPPGLPHPSRDIRETMQKYDLSARFDRLVETIAKNENLADAFCLPELKDGERIHLDSVGVASELKKRTGSTMIPTLTLRDSNRQRLLGSIAFALYAGIENLLLVRGDPYSPSEEPKNVYDIAKISGLVSSVRRLEARLANLSRLCILSPINLLKSDDDSYLKTVREREFAGVDIFLAEQMFEEEEAYFQRIERVRKFGISKPIVHSIFPLRDYEDASNCVQKFGWMISNFELHHLKIGGSQYGLEMARKRYRALVERKDVAQGACISTRGNPEIARLIAS